MIILKIDFADPEDFLDEISDRKAHIQHPIRTATYEAPPMEEGRPAPFITKVGVPIGNELLECTIVSAGEASAEQAVAKLTAAAEQDDLEIREGSRYTVGA